VAIYRSVEVAVIPAEEGSQQERAAMNAASASADVGENGSAGHENADDTQVEIPAADSRSHFVPTEEWIARVRAELPLNTVIRLLASLTPLIQELSKNDTVLTEAEVVSFLQTTTLVGLLPVPHPIGKLVLQLFSTFNLIHKFWCYEVIRKYQPNRYTSLWFTAFMWGVVFTHNQVNIMCLDLNL
jgi:hypothetical protein